MVKQIVRDPLLLQQKSEPATEADKQLIVDQNFKKQHGKYKDFTAQIIQCRKINKKFKGGQFND